MTSHGCSRDIVPLILSTSRANIHHMRPTEWWPFKTNEVIRDAGNLSVTISYVLRLPYLVITRNSNVHISQGGVRIAQSNSRNVDIWCLSQWLMVSSGVSNNQKPWLSESCLDLIGECTRGEPTMEGCSTGGSSKFQNSSLEWQSSLHTTSYILILLLKCG